MPEDQTEPEGADRTALLPVKPGGPLLFARMTGTSIAGRDAAPWITDFLNAAYYRHPVEERNVDELRLAFGVLTTYWYRRDPSRRLHLDDVTAFHRAFGAERFDTESSPRGLLTRGQLLEGAAALLGDWFPGAYGDEQRRAWGIAFPDLAERDRYDPQVRMELARVGALTPASAPPQERTWHTYPPVKMPSADGVIAALSRPEAWPDYASELGRFTPLRPGGLSGQTFEIEVMAGTESGRPVLTRGYVTVTRLVSGEEPEALAAYFTEIEDGLARYGADEPRAVPDGGEPILGFDLTTHKGHFMGSGNNRLMLYSLDGQAYVRAAGTWDPMPWHIGQAYRIAGRASQQAFWGQGDLRNMSMLHQLALRIS
jgi:hypothetical protein